MTNETDDLRRQAASRAVEEVESGMLLGLGSGDTATRAVRLIGEMLSEGRLRDVAGVPTSRTTAHIAEQCGIPLRGLPGGGMLDLTIDGADEVDPGLDLIKGLGGALLREKIVGSASRRLIIVVDHKKMVPVLGSDSPVPVEVVPIARRIVTSFLVSLGAGVTCRTDPIGRPFLTDEGNIILDCMFGPLEDPAGLANTLRSRPGVVEHGLFIGMATDVIVASPTGVEVLTRTPEAG